MVKYVWLVECSKHSLYVRRVKKSEADGVYRQHVRKERCHEIKEPVLVEAPVI